jgi:hypothetical protein
LDTALRAKVWPVSGNLTSCTWPNEPLPRVAMT